MSKTTNKPIDRWLGLGAIVVGIIYYWMPKTSTALSVSLVTIFFLLIHPLWNFWWIEEKRIRQISACIFFLIFLGLFGYFMSPILVEKTKDQVTRSQSEQSKTLAKEPTKKSEQPNQAKSLKTRGGGDTATKKIEKREELQVPTVPNEKVQEELVLKRKFTALGYPSIGWEEGWDISKGMPSIVTLRLVHPKSPMLVIHNTGVSVAREIKWTLVLWNMDIPDRAEPLPIPAQTFGWIKGGGKGGPMNLFSSTLISHLVKPGNHLIGSASVDCPTCASQVSYFIYIVFGEGGWIAEANFEKFHGQLIFPKNKSKEGLENYLYEIESLISIDARNPIREE